MGYAFPKDWANKTLVATCYDTRIDLRKAFPGLELVEHRITTAFIGDHGDECQRDRSLDALTDMATERGLRDVIILGHNDCAGAQVIIQGTHKKGLGNFLKPAEHVTADLLNGSVPAECLGEIVENRVIALSARNFETYPAVREHRSEMNIRAAKVNLATHLVTYFQAAHDNLNAHAGHAHSAGIEVYSHVPPELAQEGLR